jgi:hypothetical protein
MRRMVAAAVAVLLAGVRAADAHQLDEYLQATRIAVEADRIVLEIGLTPGVAVAEQIFATIDRNSDHQISGPEIEAYGRMVLQDLFLEFDGRPYPLTFARAGCPPWSDMREGLGTIRLQVTADVPVGTAGHHHLQFANTHRSDISVYLVNALAPSSRAITISEQRRDVLQHGIGLELDVATRSTLASWSVFPLIALATLLAYRRREFSTRQRPDVRLKPDTADIVESG